MKKCISLFAIISILSIVSCNKEGAETNVDKGQKAVTILKATVDNESTKVAVNDAGAFSWQAGDKIAVMNADGDAVEFTTTDSGASVDFSAAAEIELGDYAIYPYDASSMADNNLVIVNLPNSYSYKSMVYNISYASSHCSY